MVAAVLIFFAMAVTFSYLYFSGILSLFYYIVTESIIILLIGVPLIIIDIKNDVEINRIYKKYKIDNDLSTYKDKTKIITIFLLIEIVLGLIFSILIVKHTLDNKAPDGYQEISNTLSITTNKGNTIETEYQDLGDFSVKIPKEFGIMSSEAISAKYPIGNEPSLVYTNETGSINIVFNLNDTPMENNQIEEYIKQMEALYSQYTENIDVGFFERDGHKIGEIKFISPASDTNIYNHLIAFSIDGKLRILSFNCTEKYMNEYKDVSEFIINSITFK